MATIELDIEIPDLADVEVETPDTEITPSGGATVVVVATPGPPGIQGPAGQGFPVFGELLAGTIDGSNMVFTTAQAYQANTTAVYLNGIREPRGVGYTESGPSQITFTSAPFVDDDLRIDYMLS